MPRRRPTLLAMAFALLAALAPVHAQRHVPSPDWRDQIIYFLMIDRFANGDSRNDDQGMGEFDPADRRRYSGGDLRGATDRLDYIRGLGATAVWITPPVAHQWWNTRVGYGGYHGYWADDFSRVDPHFGSLDDYRRLADGLHARGMYLVQDIVVNHVADYFRYAAAPPAGDPGAGYRPVPDARSRVAPRQAPFHLNDPRRARDRRAAIYHWTPDIRDYADPRQEKTWQMSGLDDLNTENAQVRQALRASYGHWIREVGVDAFRVDTAFYVPPDYFTDFLHAKDPAAPGVLEVARSTGREAFHVFGEGFGVDRAFEQVQAERIEAYARDPDGRALLPGMINFPLYGTAQDVFARGRPAAELADRIERMMRVHARPHLMPTFLDNHDVDRFLAGGSEAGLRQALLMLMTLPGIPTLYYGTEQGFTAPRAAMFASGYGSDGRDRFDVDAPGYRYLQRVTGLRRANRVFSRGRPTVVAAEATRAGVLAYRMDDEGTSALVIFNTASHPVLLERLDTGLPGAHRFDPLFAIDGEAPRLGQGAPVVLPPRSGYAWRIQADAGRAATDAPPAPVLDALPAVATGRLAVSGRATPGAGLRLVVDGDLAGATPVTADRRGRWQADVRIDELIAPDVVHRLVAFDPLRGAASAAARFQARPEWRPMGAASDPLDDDRGPAGTYAYPLDPGWGPNRQGDIEHVAAHASSGSLRLDVRMRSLTRSWNPANGFDHVALTVYVELPDAPGGLRVMPLQNATLPGGMRWHRRLRVGGWSNLLSTPEGAHDGHEGTPVAPGAGLKIDPASRTVRLLLPAAALGSPASLAGARVYITTWDYDGGYRALGPQPGSHSFGGGRADSPRVLDDVVLELR